MNNTKNTIILDFDDTIVKSSEEIIRQLNQKYKLNKSIEDLKDWGYKSIYKNISPKDVFDMYGSKEFFDNVKFNFMAYEYIQEYKDIYNIVICSKGDKENLHRKEKFCKGIFQNSIQFIGLMFNELDKEEKLNKSSINIENVLFCVDDNTEALLSMNCEFKFLIKNYRETYWNKTPINQDIYVINDFSDLKKFCEFDNKLREEMILIDHQ